MPPEGSGRSSRPGAFSRSACCTSNETVDRLPRGRRLPGARARARLDRTTCRRSPATSTAGICELRRAVGGIADDPALAEALTARARASARRCIATSARRGGPAAPATRPSTTPRSSRAVHAFLARTPAPPRTAIGLDDLAGETRAGEPARGAGRAAPELVAAHAAHRSRTIAADPAFRSTLADAALAHQAPR